MKLAVIGTGHVGLVTCVAFSSLGHEVVGTDADPERVEALRRGVAPFFEPELQEALSAQIDGGRLRFTARIPEAIEGAEVAFICVGTPATADGDANLADVERAVIEVARSATAPTVIVEKSTVPTGTAAWMRTLMARERPDLRFEVVSNPEFLREGSALRDALEPDRILVGSDTAAGLESMRRVYRPLIDRGVPLIETDIPTAELAKHACNAFLALKISYANALARICELAGADVVRVTEVMGTDPRIGPDFLAAGLGYGGSCLPKDVAAFDRLAAKLGYPFHLLREVARINDEAVGVALRHVRDLLWHLEGKRVTLLGLAYKPGTDDVRSSPALELARRLVAEGAEVVGYDPYAAAEAKAQLPDLEVGSGPYEAASGAHCVVVCTAWDEFRGLDPHRLQQAMAYPAVVDGRNILDPEAMRAAGFAYRPMGRPQVDGGLGTGLG
jgi:UDPglucose 6-dehydrogenase